MISPQEDNLRARINSIIPEGLEHLESIIFLDPNKALEIASVIISFSCQAQHTGSIMAGRKAFERLPEPWLSLNLPFLIDKTLDLNEEWEFLRLLELLDEVNHNLLSTYVTIGLKHANSEIRAAAQQFAR